MSDLIINVRQISEYPQRIDVQATDTLLLQTGGLGGPYAMTSAQDFIEQAGNDPSTTIGIGVTPPANAENAGVMASNLVTPNGCTIGWNWYMNNQGGESYLNADYAGVLCFQDGVLVFAASPSGSANGPIPTWNELFGINSLTGEAYLTTATLTVARDPIAALEVVTLQYYNTGLQTILNNTVSSFNGRTGVVLLTLADVTAVGGAPLASPALTGTPTAPTPPQTSNNNTLATTAFVTAMVNSSRATSVISFNGRYGNVELGLLDITQAGGAPILAPAFTGNATAQTPLPGNNSTSIATTAFVQNAINLAINQYVLDPLTGVVQTFNGRRGNVTLQLSDITNVGGAPLNSPNFSGIPTAPTAPPGTNTSQLATTAFVLQNTADHVAGVAMFNGRTGIVDLELQDILFAGGAPINSPYFTGIPIAPKPAIFTDTNQIATCQWVNERISATFVEVVQSFNGRRGNVVLSTFDITQAGGAPIASPAFLGTPSAVTPPDNDNSTRLATTAFVRRAVDVVNDAVLNSVLTFNGRRGFVTLVANDLSAAGGALLASPTFTGTPRAPDPFPSSNDTQIATTAWVNRRIAESVMIGPPGPPGPAGPPGTGFQILGTKPRVEDLPPHGNQKGDVWIVDGIGWNWDGFMWRPIGQLAGPPGPPGIQGPPGDGLVAKGTVPREEDLPPDAQKGDFYVTEDTGTGFAWDGVRWVNLGDMRSQVPGPPGERGPPGPGIRFQGTVPTYEELPDHDQQDGDMWFVEDSGDSFVWENGRWVFAGQMRGPAGPPGPPGPAGGGVIISATPPASPQTGELWYDTSTQQLMLWTGTAWVVTGGGTGGGAAVSPTPPSSPATGDLWFNSTTNVLSVWNGTTWVAVGGTGGGIPEAPEDGTNYGRNNGAWSQVAPATGTGASPPSPAQLGQLWWNGSSLNVYNGTAWINVTGSYLSLSGGTLTGPLTLAGDATQPLQAVTLQQMDAAVSTAGDVAISDTAPSSPTNGQLWFNSATNQLMIWNQAAGAWQDASQPPVALTANPPTPPSQGDLWWDTVSAKLFIWDGSQWIIVVNTPEGGGSSGGAISGPINGVTNGSDAQAGQVGEFQTTGQQTMGGITPGLPTAVNTLALTAGDWDVWATFGLLTIPDEFPANFQIVAGLAPRANQEETLQVFMNASEPPVLGNNTISQCVPGTRVSSSTSTTVTLTAAVWSDGSNANRSVVSVISARRRR